MPAFKRDGRGWGQLNYPRGLLRTGTRVVAENYEKHPCEEPRSYSMGLRGLKFISPLRGTNSKPTYYIACFLDTNFTWEHENNMNSSLGYY